MVATELTSLRDERGTVMVEYVVVLTLVVLACMGPLVYAGQRLLDLYHYQRALLLLPLP